MFNNLQKLWQKLFTVNPDEKVPFTFDINGEKTSTNMTKKQADDLTESLFKERFFGTKK